MSNLADNECTWCEAALVPEDAPYTDAAGDPICDKCYHDNYEFTCCLCQNYEHIQYQDRFLVVAETLDAFGRRRRLGRGIYRIVAQPYYGGPIIGPGWVFPDALRRVAKLPADVDTGCYPCGHLCRECAEKLGLTEVEEVNHGHDAD